MYIFGLFYFLILQQITEIIDIITRSKHKIKYIKTEKPKQNDRRYAGWPKRGKTSLYDNLTLQSSCININGKFETRMHLKLKLTSCLISYNITVLKDKNCHILISLVETSKQYSAMLINKLKINWNNQR